MKLKTSSTIKQQKNMEVYVLQYLAEFDNEEFNNIYLYDSYEKAHKAFVDIAEGWFNEELFNTEMPTDTKVWADGKYDGFYSKYTDSEYLNIEERNNVVNYLSLSVEKQKVM